MSVDEKRFLFIDEISALFLFFVLFALPFEKPPT